MSKEKVMDMEEWIQPLMDIAGIHQKAGETNREFHRRVKVHMEYAMSMTDTQGYPEMSDFDIKWHDLRARCCEILMECFKRVGSNPPLP